MIHHLFQFCPLVENTNTIYSAFGFPLQQENWFYIIFNSEQHLICFFVHLKNSLQFLNIFHGSFNFLCNCFPESNEVLSMLTVVFW